MTILEQIKTENLKARKNKESVKASLLTTLVSEVSMIGKNDGNRQPTDIETIAVIKKFLVNAQETLGLLFFTHDVDRMTKTANEIEILKSFLPTQLNEAELKFAIDNIATEINATSLKDMGKIMKVLKERHSGTYDGAVANALIKSKF